MLKSDPSVLAGLIGGLGAVLKGVKKADKLKSIIINVIIGGLLAFLSIDLIPYVITDASEKTTLLVSFSVGFMSNELTDKLELLLDTVFEAIKKKLIK